MKIETIKLSIFIFLTIIYILLGGLVVGSFLLDLDRGLLVVAFLLMYIVSKSLGVCLLGGFTRATATSLQMGMVSFSIMIGALFLITGWLFIRGELVLSVIPLFLIVFCGEIWFYVFCLWKEFPAVKKSNN